MLVATLLLFAFTTVVSADSDNTTTEWIIPGDDTITVTYPTGQSNKVQFDCSGKDFTDKGATDQASGTSAIRLNPKFLLFDFHLA